MAADLDAGRELLAHNPRPDVVLLDIRLGDENGLAIVEELAAQAKVTRGALENAASIAAMILTTEALITDLPEKDKPSAPPMPEY